MNYLLLYLISFSLKPSDTTLLKIDRMILAGANGIDLFFSDTPERTSAENIHNYFTNGNIGEPESAVVDAANSDIVHLSFLSEFPARTNLQMHVSGIVSINSNTPMDTLISFLFYRPASYDIVIDEIMADPSPTILFPETEWVELRNVSPFEIDLFGWRLAKSTSTSGPMPSRILKPDSSLVVCSTGAVSSMNSYCSAISVTSFPALTNTGDLIALKSPEGKTIHAVNYSDEWYQNELKKQGGWSLEMIDLNNPCSAAENWSASENIAGATPGKVNSIDALNIDDVLPKLLRAYATDSLHVNLYFNEPLDSVEATNTNHYSISEGIGIPINASAEPPLFQQVKLTLNHPLTIDKTYLISANGIRDCVSNQIGIYNQVRIGLSKSSDSFDVVINEILFNPPTDGADFVELYNRSNKIINLKDLFIANRNPYRIIDNIVSASKEDYLIFPGDYLVLTNDPAAVRRKYISENPDKIFYVDGFPSYNDDEGYVVLLDRNGNIIDEVDYNEDWHFSLLDNKEGVSLERIEANAKSQDQNNWHSASSSNGYATPAYRNSQQKLSNPIPGTVSTEPKIISPNNDGKDDYLTIHYDFPAQGNVANITIYDDAGRVVRILERNALCGTTGNFRWDGLNNKYQKPGSGVYIVSTEIFNLNGEKRKFKNVVIVAR